MMAELAERARRVRESIMDHTRSDGRSQHRARATKGARVVSDLYHASDLIRAYRDNEVEVASLPQVTVCGDAS
jgi:hypothetical protein